MHAYYFSTMLALLKERGIGAREILRNTGLESRWQEDLSGVSASQMDEICINAIKLSNDAQFGLRLGSHLNISSQGIFGYAIMTSATVGDALKLLVRYSQAILPSINIELQHCKGKVEVLVRGEHLPLALEHFYCEVLYAAIIVCGSILIGNKKTQPTLELDYPPPYDAEPYHQIFGSRIKFKSERTALIFDDVKLGIAISTANPIAQDIFRRECDRLSSHSDHQGRVSERVRQVLLQAGSEFPTGAVVAKQLHMSESTLQRRLAKEDTRYQKLLDQIRYQLASEYLLSTTLPISEIACLLGFSDATNFRRSFRRWSNTTPSILRAGAKT